MHGIVVVVVIDDVVVVVIVELNQNTNKHNNIHTATWANIFDLETMRWNRKHSMFAFRIKLTHIRTTQQPTERRHNLL